MVTNLEIGAGGIFGYHSPTNIQRGDDTEWQISSHAVGCLPQRWNVLSDIHVGKSHTYTQNYTLYIDKVWFAQF